MSRKKNGADLSAIRGLIMKNFTWKPRRSLLALAILFATGTAIAEQKTHHLSIAPQSISDALKALAAETHIQIFSDGDALKI
jgi:hypothetical protein